MFSQEHFSQNATVTKREKTLEKIEYIFFVQSEITPLNSFKSAHKIDFPPENVGTDIVP